MIKALKNKGNLAPGNDIGKHNRLHSRGNRKAYEIVLPSHSPNSIYINVNLLNEEGQSLVTVLHAKHRVKLTNF